MKNIIYFFQFIVIYTLFLIFKIIGYKNSSNLGFLIGKYIGPIIKSEKKIYRIIDQVEELRNHKNKKKFVENVFGNYGRIFAEYPHLKNFRNNKLEKYILIEGEEHLKKIKDQNKRAVFISGHFNNFELMAMQIEKAGIDLAAIYRPLNNIFLNKIMEKIRINFEIILVCGKSAVLENVDTNYPKKFLKSFRNNYNL